jgi:hypothetical protein
MINDFLNQESEDNALYEKRVAELAQSHKEKRAIKWQKFEWELKMEHLKITNEAAADSSADEN